MSDLMRSDADKTRYSGRPFGNEKYAAVGEHLTDASANRDMADVGYVNNDLKHVLLLV